MHETFISLLNTVDVSLLTSTRKQRTITLKGFEINYSIKMSNDTIYLILSDLFYNRFSERRYKEVFSAVCDRISFVDNWNTFKNQLRIIL